MVCGIKTDGTLACSGWYIRKPPAGSFTQVSVGEGYACAVRDDGIVKCWGDGGGLFKGSAPTGTFKQVATGDDETYAITTEGRIMYWGGLYSRSHQPPTGSFNHIQKGDSSHICAIRNDGKTICWGYSGNSSLGDEVHVICDGAVCEPKIYFWLSGAILETDETGDGRAIPPGGNFISLALGDDYSCGVKSDLSVTCWGKDTIGQTVVPASLHVLNPDDATPIIHEDGIFVTPDLWIHAKIETVEKGTVNAVWQQGGDSFTARGDRVIWGYFYASPSDVSWGSSENPDIFVKIWFDIDGRIDVNYFHVSVPNIDVYAEYKGTLLKGITTLDRRYIRLYYNQNGKDGMDESYEDGIPAVGYSPSQNPPAYSTIKDLEIAAVINTVDGPINALWKKGGDAMTAGGHQVLWGHFYADPSDVNWGSENNPDLFVKVWFDASGRIDVNFFHVSVPDIEVYSDYPKDDSYDKKGTTIMADRYIRHEYWK